VELTKIKFGDLYTASFKYRDNIKKMVDELIQTEAGPSLWKSLVEWTGQMEHSSPILTELIALMDSMYAPKIPDEDLRIHEEIHLC
jgi:hypothetical protein